MDHPTFADGPDYLVLPTLLLLCLCVVIVLVASSSGSGGHSDPIARTYRKATKVTSRRRYAHMRVPRLPVEIIDQIIDNLSNDQRSLAACKQTQRAWLPRARLHFHRRLILRKGGLDPYKLRFFLPVAHCVRELIVAHALLREVASSVLVEIDKVEVLHITPFEGIQSPVIRASDFPRFSNIKELGLHCHCFRSPTDLFSVLAKSPRISNLTVDLRLRQSSVTGIRLEDAVTRCARLRLESLCMAFHVIMDNDAMSLQYIVLRIAGADLKHLTLDLRYFLPASVDETFHTLSLVNVSQNISLETLRVDFCWIPLLWSARTVQHNREIQQAAMFLLQIHSTRLREISFHIHVVADRHTLTTQLQHLHLRWLDSFAKPVLDPSVPCQEAARVYELAQRLQNFDLHLCLKCRPQTHDLARIHAHALSQLPGLTGRGILNLTVSTEDSLT